MVQVHPFQYALESREGFITNSGINTSALLVSVCISARMERVFWLRALFLLSQTKLTVFTVGPSSQHDVWDVGILESTTVVCF